VDENNMYLPVIYSILLAATGVFLIRHFQAPIEDPVEAKKQTKTLVGTGFFLFIVFLIGFHWIGMSREGGDGAGSGGGVADYETAMLKNMSQQTIQTGFPPF
jgi:hypothetical protein